MKAEDLVNSVEVLKQIQKKQEEIAKVQEKHQKELEELMAKLPAGVAGLLAGDSSKPAKTGERRERISLTEEQKAEIGLVAKEFVKKAKDGAKFGDIFTAVQKSVKTPINENHLRLILKGDTKSFKMSGSKINALWHISGK